MNFPAHRSGAIAVGLIAALFLTACSASWAGLWILHDDGRAGSERLAFALLIGRGERPMRALRAMGQCGAQLPAQPCEAAQGAGALSCIQNRNLYACLYIGASVPRCFARAPALHLFW